MVPTGGTQPLLFDSCRSHPKPATSVLGWASGLGQVPQGWPFLPSSTGVAGLSVPGGTHVEAGRPYAVLWQSIKGKEQCGSCCWAGWVSQSAVRKPHGGPRPWPSAGSHPLLPALAAVLGVAGAGSLTAPCFWQVPASSTTTSSCWSARVHPWPGPLPAACPRPPVPHPWPSPASSSWRSSRSGMRAKKPCQVSSSAQYSLCLRGTRWDSHEAPGPRGSASSALVPAPPAFSLHIFSKAPPS